MATLEVMTPASMLDAFDKFKLRQDAHNSSTYVTKSDFSALVETYLAGGTGVGVATDEEVDEMLDEIFGGN